MMEKYWTLVKVNLNLLYLKAATKVVMVCNENGIETQQSKESEECRTPPLESQKPERYRDQDLNTYSIIDPSHLPHLIKACF